MYTFSDVIGHAAIIDHLQNAIRMKKISHAYILHGEDDSGKNMLADIFAATLECEEGGINPCGKCKSCMQAFTGNQPDIIRVTHEKASISVDDIRTKLNNDIQIKPYSSPYKVYIIDEAEKLTEAAQNALLKTIEEPPEYAVIFLLTNNINVFLQTILSRCVTLNLKGVDKEKIKEYLMREVKIPDYQAQMCAEFSGGKLGRAVKYAASEEFVQMKNDVVHLLKYVNDMELSDMSDAIKQFGNNKANINEILDLILLWYRDVLMFKATKDVNLLLYKSEVSDIKKQADLKSFEGLEKILKALDKVKVRLGSNVNFDIALELLLMAMKESE